MKTCIIYIRVSTDEQAEKGYSKMHQSDALQRFCLANSIEVQQIIFEDYSAKTFNRPGWKRMFANFKDQKKHRPDLLLFTKWDRFSRNTSDAYYMIRILNEYGIEPQAIEQPLDLEIPENKMMLAIYLAAPEVENDRRALNVFHGMRRAKKEGRWMGSAPVGYANRATTSGDKYICPQEPQAGHMRRALLEIAEGKFNIEQIWNSAKQNGLKCSRSNFHSVISNPVYCGKIIIPAYRDEALYWADGLHEGIISNKIFMQILDVIKNKKTKPIKKKCSTPPQLYLRGFLACLKCNRMLTGSPSTGRSAIYYYYHCQSSCGCRFRADIANNIIEDEITRWKIKEGFSLLYAAILNDYRNESKRANETDQINTIKKIEQQQVKLNRARELFINGDIDKADYQQIKTGYAFKIKQLQEFSEINEKSLKGRGAEIKNRIRGKIKLIDFFKIADTKSKQELINLMFPGNLLFNKNNFEIKQYGLAFSIIYRKL